MWVFDTGSIANICNSQHDRRNKRHLEGNEMTMRVGVDVMAEGTLHLRLPTGMILFLNTFYYVTALSMNIVSGSRITRDGYHFESITNGCSILKMVFSMFMRLCSALPFEKGRTPLLSAIPWITDSTTVQNIVIIATVSKLQRRSSYTNLNLTNTQRKAK
jgi:hypothetical protein